MAGGDADTAAVNDSSSQSCDDSQVKTCDKTDATKSAESGGDEVVVIQDTGFNISIVAPGVDPFDLPVCYLVTFLPCAVNQISCNVMQICRLALN